MSENKVVQFIITRQESPEAAPYQEKFEIPYSAVALDIVLRSGEKYVVQGIVDPQMVSDYLELIKKCDH